MENEFNYWIILWVIIGIIVVTGIIRLIITKPKGIGEAIMEFLFIDCLFDILGAVFENIDLD